MAIYVVMRRPVLMEDEGQHSVVATFSSRDEAAYWIAAQANEYFRPGDYYIASGVAADCRTRTVTPRTHDAEADRLLAGKE